MSVKIKEMKLRVMQQECNIAEKELKIDVLKENIKRVEDDILISKKQLETNKAELSELTKEG